MRSSDKFTTASFSVPTATTTAASLLWRATRSYNSYLPEREGEKEEKEGGRKGWRISGWEGERKGEIEVEVV